MPFISTIQPKQNKTTVTNRLPSPAIWNSCPWLDIIAGNRDGLIDGDDFVSADNEDGSDNSYLRYIDTGNTIRILATNTTALATGVRGGVLRLDLDASDNDGPVIQRQTANGAGQVLIGNTSGAAWKLFFEARVRKSLITDNGVAFAVGLAQVGRAADDGLLDDNAGDIVDSISFIGFRNKHDNGEELDFVYQDGGQTAPTETIANIAAMVADTWVKVGFVYDPAEVAEKKIKIFLNNAEQGTYVTTTNIDAATFPENDVLSFVFGAKNGTAAVSTADIDWWRLCQLYD